ncbi:MAG TPA: nucleotidyltransferase family protein [Accumulibacter sp.]|uniref:nucleotidyltransferase domain-containing protein n=1 Tax=Accumulibacter sp. TaxID=2053492 RepID=UPI002C0366DE|nr:nucleotidyltransferase family protein [Accumulibacter sp.]HRD89850.1 nucleotidyltransferase family protein [Accumulibacter sp.]
MSDQRLAADAFQLLQLLRDPGRVRDLRLGDWDKLVRLARRARLLGVLAQRIQSRAEDLAAVPDCVRGHLDSAIVYSAHRVHLLRLELAALSRVLPADVRVAVLKGGAYIIQDLATARGRLPNDVDLLVSRDDLRRSEAALLAAGWEAQAVDDYADRYYREWSHELPPMRFPGHPMEVDLHHTISPVTGRLQPDRALLFADLQEVAGERFLVLHPLDQILHAVIHLFQDSELVDNLRDLVDIDSLLRTYLRSAEDWLALTRRAGRHGVERPLWYALHYCRKWLATPVPDGLALRPPPIAMVQLMDWLYPCCTLPRLADQPPTIARGIAERLGRARYQWLRMPPGLLLRHLGHKSVRALRWRPAAQHRAE